MIIRYMDPKGNLGALFRRGFPGMLYFKHIVLLLVILQVTTCCFSQADVLWFSGVVFVCWSGVVKGFGVEVMLGVLDFAFKGVAGFCTLMVLHFSRFGVLGESGFEC